MSSQKTLINLLGKTEGRDKLLKFAAGLMRIIATYTNAKQHALMASQVSETRSILRFVLWISNLRKIQLMFVQGQVKVAMDYVMIFRILGDFVYCVHDNLAYATKYGLILSKQHMPGLLYRGFVGMFWGFFAAVVLDIHALVTMDPQNEKDYRESWKARVLLLTRNTCDMLAALSQVGYLGSSLALQPRTLGVLAMISGGISSHENWNKSVTA